MKNEHTMYQNLWNTAKSASWEMERTKFLFQERNKFSNKIVQPFWKRVCQFLISSITVMLPSYFITRYLAKRTETFPYKDYLKKHIAAIFIVVKRKQIQMPINWWIYDLIMPYSYNELAFTNKRNELLIHKTMCMNLKEFCQINEASQNGDTLSFPQSQGTVFNNLFSCPVVLC